MIAQEHVADGRSMPESAPQATAEAGAGVGPTWPRYVIITPARNEAQFIELTLKSMVRQTVPPLRWVIVSDGSTDETDEIVSKYVVENPWIQLLRMPERAERHFAGKVHAFNAGYDLVKDLHPHIIGNLDADISLEPDHFQILVSKYYEDPRLGVWGAPFREGTQQYDYNYSNIENVWGGCQLFRRECYEEIGGYVPVKGGCVDHIAVVTARMKGWKTRTFTERVCIHHRLMGTAERNVLRAKFKLGAKDYSMGNHPVWQLARVCYQMTKPPVAVGGAALAAGYLWSAVQRRDQVVPRDLATFSRREQMLRLKRFVARSHAG